MDYISGVSLFAHGWALQARRQDGVKGPNSTHHAGSHTGARSGISRLDGWVDCKSSSTRQDDGGHR